MTLPHVRLAVAADVPDILTLGREIHAENACMPLSEDRIQAAAWRAVNQQRCMMGVIGPHDRIEGAIYLTVGQFWYTDELHLEELFAFVRPEYRRSENMKALLAFAKTCSERLNVPLLIGVIATTRTAAKIRLYERRLGKQSGAYFLYGKENAA